MWGLGWGPVFFISYGCLIAQALFVEKAILLPFNCLCTCVKKSVEYICAPFILLKSQCILQSVCGRRGIPTARCLLGDAALKVRGTVCTVRTALSVFVEVRALDCTEARREKCSVCPLPFRQGVSPPCWGSLGCRSQIQLLYVNIRLLSDFGNKFSTCLGFLFKPIVLFKQCYDCFVQSFLLERAVLWVWLDRSFFWRC